MFDYHHFNNPRLLKEHFEKLDKIASVVIVPSREAEDYERAIQSLSMLARLVGVKLRDLEGEARQISVETGISFVEAAEKVKEKYLR